MGLVVVFVFGAIVFTALRSFEGASSVTLSVKEEWENEIGIAFGAGDCEVIA